MTAADAVVSRWRRDLALGTFVKSLLLGLAVAIIVLGPFFNLGSTGSVLLVALAVVWMVLSHRSARSSRAVMDAPAMIAMGRQEEAEAQIQEALQTFSIFRAIKLLSLHHLALLRHSQQRWEETATLCRALQRQKLGGMTSLLRPSKLLLTDSLLHLNDLPGAYDAIRQLYQQRLTLGEAMHLLVMQLDYESRVGAWANMVAGIESKVPMCELMNAKDAALSQALLALAAKKMEMQDWSAWLKRRAELVGDVNEMVVKREVLKELWS